MKITFLGTGTSQGIPIIGSTHPVCLSDNFKDKRLRCSAMITWDDNVYVIDCSPDFRQQMLRQNVSKIDGILFTHEHTDHIIGLDDIRPFFYRQKKDIPLYADERVFKALSSRFHYIIDSQNKYPGTPNVRQTVISAKNTIQLQNKKVQPIDIMHGNLPILGFRVDNLVYLTDVKTVPEHSYQHLKNIDILVVNALREEAHFSHFTLEEALAFIRKIQPKRAYLTHISHLLGFHDEVEKSLPSNVFLAYDGLELEFN
ncbi:MBL fold metallo-hydrolase [Aquimarina agarivorans]|uniref:MBL fold metallo-hydrolase n=1 Tax=Aquimarina agarivorans TaxID=980584 RepID=UPI000248FC6D|nr:MBL fold metallo-hydrolase [Aquimarina agarivorans]